MKPNESRNQELLRWKNTYSRHGKRLGLPTGIQDKLFVHTNIDGFCQLTSRERTALLRFGPQYRFIGVDIESQQAQKHGAFTIIKEIKTNGQDSKTVYKMHVALFVKVMQPLEKCEQNAAKLPKTVAVAAAKKLMGSSH